MPCRGSLESRVDRRAASQRPSCCCSLLNGPTSIAEKGNHLSAARQARAIQGKRAQQPRPVIANSLRVHAKLVVDVVGRLSKLRYRRAQPQFEKYELMMMMMTPPPLPLPTCPSPS